MTLGELGAALRFFWHDHWSAVLVATLMKVRRLGFRFLGRRRNGKY